MGDSPPLPVAFPADKVAAIVAGWVDCTIAGGLIVTAENDGEAGE